MKNKEYRTLKGFLDGDELEEGSYFAYSATLRIFGNIDNLIDITNSLGFEPTSSHKKGEKRGANSSPYKHDMWSYEVQIDEEIARYNIYDYTSNHHTAIRNHCIRRRVARSKDVGIGDFISLGQ